MKPPNDGFGDLDLFEEAPDGADGEGE